MKKLIVIFALNLIFLPDVYATNVFNVESNRHQLILKPVFDSNYKSVSISLNQPYQLASPNSDCDAYKAGQCLVDINRGTIKILNISGPAGNISLDICLPSKDNQHSNCQHNTVAFIPSHTIFVAKELGTFNYGHRSNLMFSSDDGQHWSEASTPPFSGWLKTDFSNIFVQGANLYLTRDDGSITISQDVGNTWVQTKPNPNDSVATDITGNDTTLYVSTIRSWFQGDSNIMVSHDKGKTWTPTLNRPLEFNNLNIVSLYLSGNTLFAASDSGKIFLTNDEGVSWGSQYNLPMHDRATLNSIFIQDETGTLYVAVSHLGLISTTGLNWRIYDRGLSFFVDNFFAEGNKLYANDYGQLVKISDDDGKNWAQTPTNPLNNDPGKLTGLFVTGDK